MRSFYHQDFVDLQEWARIREEEFEATGLAIKWAYKSLSGAIGLLMYLRYGGSGGLTADEDNEYFERRANEKHSGTD